MAMTETAEDLAGLYEKDETAWLEAMAELISEGKLDELDYPHLAEYLSDMAQREKREVKSRLVVLIAHVLKWDHQKKKRSRSWRLTIETQRQELLDILESNVLRSHARSVLAKSYRDAVRQASAETGLPETKFPEQCRYSLDALLSEDVIADS
jgi:hypothetical protein